MQQAEETMGIGVRVKRSELVRYAIGAAEYILQLDPKQFIENVLRGFPLEPTTEKGWSQVKWLHDQREPELFGDHETLRLTIMVYSNIADLEDGILRPRDLPSGKDMITAMIDLQNHLRTEISAWRRELSGLEK